jgi:two-component system, LytTR family, sensor kinase
MRLHLKKYWIAHSLFWILHYLLLTNGYFDGGRAFTKENIYFFLLDLEISTYVASCAYSILWLAIKITFNAKKNMGIAILILTIITVYAYSAPHIINLILDIISINEERASNSYIPRAVTFSFVTLLVYGLYSVLENYETNKKLVAMQQLNQENAMNLLKNQVNPHFLMNTLNNIYSVIIRREGDAAKMILQLSDLLRHSYSTIELKYITLREEINYLDNYIALEQIRLSQKVNIQFNKQVQNLDLEIAPMMLITLVENAFKHGLSELIHDGYLNIDLALQGNQLFFSVENSVPVLSKVKEGTHSTGLNNLEERLKLIYPNKHKLYFQKEANKYKITLEIAYDV